jgi:quercetin dioxygenase-like cupin family protein
VKITASSETDWQAAPAARFIGGAGARLRMFDIPAEQTALTAMTVQLTDGARTAWHSHPCGQILIAVSGLGEVQASGSQVVTLRPGDSIWAEPGERHWHGAAAGHDFVYTSIQPTDPVTGSFADWEE